MIEQLQQLCTVTWDGNLISKRYRDELCRAELAERVSGGFNLITRKGLSYLRDLGLLPKKVRP